jgi:NADH-quinone oxidoreductase subunit J
MTISLLLFYLFAGVTVSAAIGVVVSRNPVHAALFLVLAFVSTSGLWVLLHAEFLAVALIVVYVGAVMVLFLFVVMMLDIKVDPLQEGFARYLPVGLLVAGVMLFQMLTLLSAKYFGLSFDPMAKTPVNYSNTEEIGLLLFTKYAFPFEIASVVLLVAAIAAVALTLRKRIGVKTQDPSAQVLVTKAQRLKLVSMEASAPQPLSAPETVALPDDANPGVPK